MNRLPRALAHSISEARMDTVQVSELSVLQGDWLYLHSILGKNTAKY